MSLKNFIGRRSDTGEPAARGVEERGDGSGYGEAECEADLRWLEGEIRSRYPFVGPWLSRYRNDARAILRGLRARWGGVAGT